MFNDTSEKCTVFSSPEEVVEEVEHYAFSWIVFTNANLPDVMAYPYDYIFKMFKEGNFSSWLKGIWTSQAQAIIIP